MVKCCAYNLFSAIYVRCIMASLSPGQDDLDDFSVAGYRNFDLSLTRMLFDMGTFTRATEDEYGSQFNAYPCRGVYSRL